MNSNYLIAIFLNTPTTCKIMPIINSRRQKPVQRSDQDVNNMFVEMSKILKSIASSVDRVTFIDGFISGLIDDDVIDYGIINSHDAATYEVAFYRTVDSPRTIVTIYAN